jgi:hypothetical protein
MSDETHILEVEKDSHDGLIVTFSDGTTAGYVVEELLELRPVRERVEKPKGQPPPHTGQRGLNAGWLLTETIPLSEDSKGDNGRVH